MIHVPNFGTKCIRVKPSMYSTRRRRQRIVAVAARDAIPAMYFNRELSQMVG
jgi:hypothetical protein